MSFVFVVIKENSAGVNTAYIYNLSVIITWESTCVCNGLVLSLYAIPLICAFYTVCACVSKNSQNILRLFHQTARALCSV
jgi:hypothetical protein